MHATKLCPVLLAVAVLALPALAGDVPDYSTNVLVTFEVGTMENGKDVVRKTYEMIVNANNEPVEMSTGARIPIPTTTFNTSNSAGSNVVPVTSFAYQHVGFLANIRAEFNEDGTIRLRGRIEDSSLTGTPAADGRPFIQSMDQQISATLTDGKPLRINRVDESDTRSFFIQLQAERLDEAGERVAKN
ncbi:MAG: hypothetical protein GTO30_11920 [Acidobacteria bacterium]|nr:hypothetical protein [Acidobacteriota bacterium]NIM62334.1 hypothetical protein [Acidobacteriota bacterium]NIO60667.1 hypothetical protein [Acidobacteriota bacterium]NIQ85100.1 hypothetical protein [Acidobacteriota bacterium]NIT12311.1 hypothetical protein [Acidobacteriota bacterium]